MMQAMPRWIDKGNYILWVEALYTPAECHALVAHAESLGFEEAPVTTAQGPRMMRDMRSNQRVMRDELALAAGFFGRLGPFLPTELMGWQLHGLNERVRWYRYDPGQRFDWHRDGAFVRGPQERSLLTVLLYLSEGCEGGETRFRLGDAPELAVAPRVGGVLVFPHLLPHLGAEVRSGRKDVLRTDVMYRRALP